MNILIDGNQIPETEFDTKFEEIVGLPWKEWTRKPSTSSDGGSEWYRWEDDKFILSGSAYENPKLIQKNL